MGEADSLEITGGSTSSTVTVKLQVAELDASWAVHVTVVVPTGKIFPEGTPLRVTAPRPAQLSLAEAAPSVASLTTVPQDVAPAPV